MSVLNDSLAGLRTGSFHAKKKLLGFPCIDVFGCAYPFHVRLAMTHGICFLPAPL
jgi:hypothetical protein